MWAILDNGIFDKMTKRCKMNKVWKAWKTNIFWIAVIIVACFVGCDKFWQEGDEIVKDVNAVAGGAQAILESPAGQVIPPEWKLYGALGVILANGLVITWEELRNRMLKKTTKAIVKGIEASDNPDKATSEVKANIADAMMAQGGDKFYDRANKIVDRLKIS
ncbi:hypothetical protein ES705_10550 [subsurface metagenome]